MKGHSLVSEVPPSGVEGVVNKIYEAKNEVGEKVIVVI